MNRRFVWFLLLSFLLVGFRPLDLFSIPLQKDPRPMAVVGVVGDIAHAPRMLEHAQQLAATQLFSEIRLLSRKTSLAKLQHVVDTLNKSSNTTRFSFYFYQSYWSVPNWLPSEIRMPLRLWMDWPGITRQLLTALHTQGHVIVLLQNPPLLPMVPGVLLSSSYGFNHFKRNLSIVIDVHNYGADVLHAEFRRSLFGYRLLFEQFYRWIEWFSINVVKPKALLAVTDALALDLHRHLDTCDEEGFVVTSGRIIPVYDGRVETPASSLAIEEEDPLFSWNQIRHLCQSTRHCKAPNWSIGENSRLLQTITANSWDYNENHEVLLDALERLSTQLTRSNQQQPSSSSSSYYLWVMLTGKGPRRSLFESRVQSSSLLSQNPFLFISFAFFESYSTYLRVLSLADVFVGVHGMPGGKDLPFGMRESLSVGTPYLAYHTGVIDQTLSREFLYDSSQELADKLAFLLHLDGEKDNTDEQRLQRWKAETNRMRHMMDSFENIWRKTVLPLMKDLIKKMK